MTPSAKALSKVISLIPMTIKSVLFKAPFKFIMDKMNIKIIKKININPIHPLKLFLIVISIPPIFKDENKKNKTAKAAVPMVIIK